MVNPVDDAKAPMRETEAPRLRAKKGYRGIEEAFAASMKNIVMQSAITPRRLSFPESSDMNAQFTRMRSHLSSTLSLF
jgi:hypothetical protein